MPIMFGIVMGLQALVRLESYANKVNLARQLSCHLMNLPSATPRDWTLNWVHVCCASQIFL
jgi:hypothetical protein